jgi:hypothetical protein
MFTWNYTVTGTLKVKDKELCMFVFILVFNAIFNSISVIFWRSVLLVEETGENHQSAASHWQTLSHN